MRLTIATFFLLLGALSALVIFSNTVIIQKEVIFNLAPGSSAKSMVRQLQKEHILTPLQAWLFYGWIQCNNAQKRLQAGEYRLVNLTPKQLLQKLITGEVVQHRLVLVEGSTFEQVLKMLNEHPAIKKTLTDKSSQQVIQLLDETYTKPEGLLFPDTYYFTLQSSDILLLKQAFRAMQTLLHQAWENRDPTIILKTPYEALILASIIEKETAVSNEKALISGVFQRRLASNMRLQADPTVVYGLGKDFTGPLTRAHLKQDTPYNTYLYKGLPPTPIGLPGKVAIEAALHPVHSEALYFVAKGDGTHYFSNTLTEHNQAVARYRRGEK